MIRCSNIGNIFSEFPSGMWCSNKNTCGWIWWYCNPGHKWLGGTLIVKKHYFYLSFVFVNQTSSTFWMTKWTRNSLILVGNDSSMSYISRNVDYVLFQYHIGIQISIFPQKYKYVTPAKLSKFTNKLVMIGWSDCNEILYYWSLRNICNWKHLKIYLVVQVMLKTVLFVQET